MRPSYPPAAPTLARLKIIVEHGNAHSFELAQGLARQFAVNVHIAAPNLNRLAGQANDALHERLSSRRGAAKDDHLPPPRLPPREDAFIDKQMIAAANWSLVQRQIIESAVGTLGVRITAAPASCFVVIADTHLIATA